jgi:SPP1 gp7 family putative phage head morphogenesis protein
MRAQGFGREKTIFELKELGLITEADFNRIRHKDAIDFLTKRSFDSLKKWTDAMTVEVRQILTDAVIEGDSLEVIIKNITERIDVSRSRARVIAATEINQAYSQSSINEAIAQSEELGEPVSLRWLTVRDSKVRHLHARFHGEVMTPQDASRNKSISPWNCRCGWAPVVGEQTEAQSERFSQQRQQLLQLEQNV